MKKLLAVLAAGIIFTACTKDAPTPNYIQNLPEKDGWKPGGQSNYVGRGIGGDQEASTYISPGTNDDNKPRAAAVMPADVTTGQQSMYVGPGSHGDQGR
jgi:hypothetical protein